MEGNNIDYSVQSIRDSLIQAGCINEKIKAVFKVNKFLLAENYTGNVYKYEAINCLTHEKKYLFFTKKPVAESKHAEIAERIIKMFVLDKEPMNRADGSVSQINGFAKEKDVRKAGKQTFVAIKDNSEIYSQLSENIIEPYEPVATISAKPDADENFILIINKIFKEELPEYGYAIRKSQIELAEMIFRTLQTGNISLCEAEVGIGKTHAYIIAAIIHRLNNKNFNRIRTSYPLSNDFYMSPKMPVVISTSSIALQKAVAYDYIPEISKILMSCGLIDKPLSCVIRKGKEHYICDKRLNDYTASLSAKNNKNEKDIAVEKLLNQLRSAGFLTIDLDDYDNLSCYVKSRICVSSQCNSKCDMFSTCRYNRYLKHAKSYNHDFQICNHNYLLADVRHRSKGLSPLIPNYQAVIIDEAHKLIGAARQMYGNSITSHEIPRLMSYILKMKYRQERTTKLIESYCNRLLTLNNNLFDELKKPVLDYDTEDDTERYKTVITPTAQKTIKSVIYTLESLIGMLEDSSCLKDRPKSIYKYILRSLRELVDRFKVYLDCRNIVYWIEIPGGDIKFTGKTVLCSIPKCRFVKHMLHLAEKNDELKKLKDPVYMKKVYEANKDVLAENTRKKIERALEECLNFKEKRTVSVINVARFFQTKVNIDEGNYITPLKLQKLLYYAQGWHLAFFDKPLFDSELQAWVYGPVSPEIYRTYQKYHNALIEMVDFDYSNVFDAEQIELLDIINNTYGNFDAILLKKMTHWDLPWREARKGLASDQPSNVIIEKECIKNYFKKIKTLFNINKLDDIKKSMRLYEDIIFG